MQAGEIFDAGVGREGFDVGYFFIAEIEQAAWVFAHLGDDQIAQVA